MTFVPLVFDPADDMVIVFRLPDVLPSDYCFNGGHAVPFLMVDWFNAPRALRAELELFISGKNYATASSNLLVLALCGEAFLIRAPS